MSQSNQLANCMKRDLRILGASLGRQIAASASLDQLVAIKGPKVNEGRRPLRCEPEPVFPVLQEQSGPEPEGQSQPGGRQAMRLAAIRQDRCGIPLNRCRRLAAGHSCCCSSPGAEQPHHLIPFLRGEVECCEVGVTLRRRYDPALMRSPERLGVARVLVEGIAAVMVLNERAGNTRSSQARARCGRQRGRSLHQTTPSRARPFAASAVHQ